MGVAARPELKVWQNSLRFQLRLDEIADWIDTHPGVAKRFRHELIFDLPEGWADRIEEEFDRIDRKWKWL